MPLTYVGRLSFSAMMPVVSLSIGDVGKAINANLVGAASVKASLIATPPTLSSTLSVSSTQQASLVAASTAIPPVPNVSFGVSAAATLVAKFTAAPGFLATLLSLLSASPGIFAYGYVGVANALGGAITTELSTQWRDGTPSSGASNAIILGGIDTTSIVKLGAFVAGAPLTSGLVYGGKLALPPIFPTLSPAAAQGSAGIARQLAISQALQASLSISRPTLAAAAISQTKFGANVSAFGRVAAPTVAIAAQTATIANLTASFGNLGTFGAAFGNEGATFFAFTYSGAGNAMGAAISTQLATQWPDGTSSSGACAAVMLGTVDGPSWTTLISLFGGL